MVSTMFVTISVFEIMNKMIQFLMRLELEAIKKMKNFSIVINSIGDKKSYTYYLLVLNSLANTIKIHTYNRSNIFTVMRSICSYMPRK